MVFGREAKAPSGTPFPSIRTGRCAAQRRHFEPACGPVGCRGRSTAARRRFVSGGDVAMRELRAHVARFPNGWRRLVLRRAEAAVVPSKTMCLAPSPVPSRSSVRGPVSDDGAGLPFARNRPATVPHPFPRSCGRGSASDRHDRPSLRVRVGGSVFASGRSMNGVCGIVLAFRGNVGMRSGFLRWLTEEKRSSKRMAGMSVFRDEVFSIKIIFINFDCFRFSGGRGRQKKKGERRAAHTDTNDNELYT